MSTDRAGARDGRRCLTGQGGCSHLPSSASFLHQWKGRFAGASTYPAATIPLFPTHGPAVNGICAVRVLCRLFGCAASFRALGKSFDSLAPNIVHVASEVDTWRARAHDAEKRVGELRMLLSRSRERLSERMFADQYSSDAAAAASPQDEDAAVPRPTASREAGAGHADLGAAQALAMERTVTLQLMNQNQELRAQVRVHMWKA